MDYAQTRPTKILEYFDGVFEFTDAEKQKYFGEAVAKIQAWSNAQGGAETGCRRREPACPRGMS